MKALKVFCVILTVIMVIVTGTVFAFNRLLNSEVRSVTDTHKRTVATIENVGNEYTYTIKDSEIKAMPEAQYLEKMKKGLTGTGYVMAAGGVLTALFFVGAVASGKAVKRRNSGFAAA